MSNFRAGQCPCLNYSTNLMKKLAILLPALLGLPAYGQIAGTVVDTARQPVPFANVALLSLPDSALVSGAVTAADGAYRFTSATAGCLLRASALGYHTTYALADTLRGPLVLRPDGQLLGEATVTAQRPVSRIEGDALVTTVQGSVLEKAGTAEDVLGRVPGITKEQDGFNVLGKGAPVFYINGRQVRDNSELERLRSDEIRSVEVVQSPGARYDATVNAVVRIRTVKRTGTGFSANAMASYYQGEYPSGNAQLDLNYRYRSLDVFATAKYSAGKTRWRSTIDNVTYADTLWRQRSTQDIYSRQHHVNTTLGFNYDLNERHSFGLRYDLTLQPSFRSSGPFNGQIWADGVLYDELTNRIETEEENDATHALNAYYLGHLGKGELNIDADFYADGSETRQITEENSANYDDRLVASTNPVRNRLVAARADYSYPLWKGKVSVGGQFTATNRHDDYLVPVDEYGLATSRSQLKENNAAAYLQWNGLTKLGMLTAGLRYEHVTFDYFTDGVRQPDQSRTFNNVFPSISFATQLGHTQVMASYTAKTQRPSYGQLRNNVTYGNRFLMTKGNPHLDPTIVHDLTLTGVWKFIQGVVSFRKQHRAVLNWTQPLEGSSSSTVVTYLNHDYPSLSAVLSVAPKIGWWQPTWTAALMSQWLTLHTAERTVKFNNPMLAATWNNAFDFPRNYLLNVDFTYLSPGNQQNATIVSRDICMLNVSLRKSFFNDAFSVTVGGEDLFQRLGRVVVRVGTGTNELAQANFTNWRRFFITLRYRFNPVKSKYKGKSVAGDELKRL